MDDRKLRNPQDSSRIDVNEPWELRYWTKELGVSEERLKEVVRQVGVSAEKVRSHLSSR